MGLRASITADLFSLHRKSFVSTQHSQSFTRTIEQVSSTRHQSFAVRSSHITFSSRSYKSISLPFSGNIQSFYNMFYSAIATAAALLTLAPSALAVGTAHVVNNCGMPVYFASVAQNVAAGMSELPSSGYSEGYTLANVGVSIKLSPNATGSVTQFEFTWANGDIAYDISNINGNPFSAQGMQLTPSMQGASGYPTCQTVSCPAGQASCSAAYNQPDDVRTMVCPEDSDLTFTLCPGGGNKRDITTPVFRSHSHRMHARQFK